MFQSRLSRSRAWTLPRTLDRLSGTEPEHRKADRIYAVTSRGLEYNVVNVYAPRPVWCICACFMSRVFTCTSPPPPFLCDDPCLLPVVDQASLESPLVRTIMMVERREPGALGRSSYYTG